MKHYQQNNITIKDFINCKVSNTIDLPSIEYLAKVKKDQIILSLIRIEDLKKKILKSPDNRVLKLALFLVESRLRSQKRHYSSLNSLILKK